MRIILSYIGVVIDDGLPRAIQDTDGDWIMNPNKPMKIVQLDSSIPVSEPILPETVLVPAAAETPESKAFIQLNERGEYLTVCQLKGYYFLLL